MVIQPSPIETAAETRISFAGSASWLSTMSSGSTCPGTDTVNGATTMSPALSVTGMSGPGNS